MKKRQLLYVEWRDHHSGGGWLTEGEVEQTDYVVRSIGWLFKEDDRYLCLATNLSQYDQASCRMSIIKSDIIKKKRITVD